MSDCGMCGREHTHPASNFCSDCRRGAVTVRLDGRTGIVLPAEEAPFEVHTTRANYAVLFGDGTHVLTDHVPPNEWNVVQITHDSYVRAVDGRHVRHCRGCDETYKACRCREE